MLQGEVLNAQTLQVFHRVRVHICQVLIAQIDVPLCEDVPIPIVVTVPSQLIGKVLCLCQYARAILKQLNTRTFPQQIKCMHDE